jgi:hypothetical protein
MPQFSNKPRRILCRINQIAEPVRIGSNMRFLECSLRTVDLDGYYKTHRPIRSLMQQGGNNGSKDKKN